MMQQAPLAGVIGDPIGQSKSPRVHGHWLAEQGIAGHYVPLHVTPDRLADTLALLPHLGFKGINVTIPHKETVLAMATEASDAARQIGAANTLTFLKDGGFHADNTDGYGFLENLRAARPDWTPASGPAAVLGAGGASRAVVFALIEAGCPDLRIANRTRARAEALADAFGDKVTVFDWADAPRMMTDVHLAVNATSLGMGEAGGFPLDLSALPPSALATDLIYAPLDTPFLQAARAMGCATVDGLGMLLHQAVPGFQRWFGQRPVVTPELRDVVLAG